MAESAESCPAYVAVIEDDEASRTALGRLLQAGGFTAVLFASAETFIAALSIRPWRCLIVDVHLTGMSGLELQRILRTEGADLPVIITTGNRADEIRQAAERDGCAAFLGKPVRADSLLAAVRSIAAHPGP